MVPQSAHKLSVRIVVIFVLSRISAVLSPAIEGSSAVASVKMDNDGLSYLLMNGPTASLPLVM